MTPEERGWIAGIIEGEGYIRLDDQGLGRARRLRIAVKMTDEDVIARFASILGVSYRAKPFGNRPTHYKQQYEVSVSNARAERLAQEIGPLLGERRRAQLDRCVETKKGGI